MKTTVWIKAEGSFWEPHEYPGCYAEIIGRGRLQVTRAAGGALVSVYEPEAWGQYQVSTE